MEGLILIVVFAFIFSVLYAIFSKGQKKYTGLDMRRVDAETGAGLDTGIRRPQAKKEGLMGVLSFLGPLAQKIVPQRQKEGLSRDLITAGKPLTIIEYYALVLVLAAVGLIGGLVMMNVTAQDKSNPNIAVPFIGLAVGFMLPSFWLKRKKRERQKKIAIDLPSIIDLLNLCVGSGIDFMLAVQRVIREYKKCPLTEELTTLWQENNMGVPRREALRSLSWRVNLPEMSSFVSTLIQADKMGTPISDALEIQAEQIRIKRFQRGEEQALKAPIKLLIPLIFFILPVVAIIVAAPIIMQFLKGGIQF